MDFTIVIPCFNCPERVNYLLESIFKFYPGVDSYKIIVSDDCSPKKEETRKVSQKWGVLFTHPGEWGCVGRNTNHAVNLSRDDLVFVINDDLIISKGTFKAMLKFWEDNQHLKIGATGFTFIQSYQLVSKGIIPHVDNFYPPTWNDGEINYNALELEYKAFPTKFTEPILTSTPSGPCFAVSKKAWEEAGKFHEFGMWEGGAFHAMWENGYVICMVPTPPLLHALSQSTNDSDKFLQEMYRDNPERRPWMHEEGEKIYKDKRGKRYDDDTAYIWEKIIYPQKDKIKEAMRYDNKEIY